jgi:hypothetical protein
MRLIILALGLLACAGVPAMAEYPDRPVTVIHNYGPGTASDATARSLAEACATAINSEPFRRAVAQFGIVDHRGRAEFGRLLAREYQGLGSVLRDLQVQPE